jgi:hypothetical protein
MPLTNRFDSSVGELRRRLDGFADRDRWGNVLSVEQFLDGDPQDRAVEGGHPVDAPLLRVALEEQVDRREMRFDALDELT